MWLKWSFEDLGKFDLIYLFIQETYNRYLH
jgi:hypothetical protein